MAGLPGGAPAHAPWRPLLRGRRAECDDLDQMLREAAAGRSAVRVLRGEAGVGKTALLDHAAERASGFRVVRAMGVQAEMELPYAGVHQLCAPMLNRVTALPAPQRDALRVAFGLREGGAPDHFMVALATLGLLSEAAEAEPVVCVVDDAQWLDRASAQALAFVARRLLAERIAMVFAVREPADAPELAGLPERAIGGLPDADARLLLASGIPGRLDERVRDRIVAETRGNPLALLELPRGMTPAELAGGFGVPEAGSLAGRIEQVFLGRVAGLPAATRQLLLVAAAEPLGDVPLLWRAAGLLGIAADAAVPAEAAGLVDLGVRVRFRHPLVRSAIYRTAEPARRRRVHAALADATDADADPDRLAWHRAHATTGLDERVAAELERSAARARRRGGASAAAAFLQRATELTPGPARRATRALAGAQAKIEAADLDGASNLLATADLGPLGAGERARVRLLRARIAFALRRGGDALPLLLDAAQGLAAHDTGLAGETRLEAFAAAIFAGDPGARAEVRDVARAVLAAPPAADAGPVEALARGLATAVTDGFPAAAGPLRTALEAFRRAGAGADRWLWLACRIASDLFDDRTWDELTDRAVRAARAAGTLSTLPIAAGYRAGVHLHAGEFAQAAALMEESSAITRTTDTAPLIYPPPMLAAYRGDEAAAVPLLDAARHDAAARGQGLALSMLACSRAVLLNGLARYDEAVAAAGPVPVRDDLGLYALNLAELVEAAARSGRTDVAAAALARLAERTRASGTDWALGMEARSRALLAEGPAAEALYAEAVERLGAGRVALHRARARLVYGEWLRRENRRADARRELAAAHDMFDGFGAEAFAARARRELAATGETARRRATEALGLLTAQEAQIARLAGEGMTNPEIGARLFISPRTVEYHLRKVFPKLDIASRKELRHVLSRLPGGPTGDHDRGT